MRANFEFAGPFSNNEQLFGHELPEFRLTPPLSGEQSAAHSLYGRPGQSVCRVVETSQVLDYLGEYFEAQHLRRSGATLPGLEKFHASVPTQ